MVLLSSAISLILLSSAYAMPAQRRSLRAKSLPSARDGSFSISAKNTLNAIIITLDNTKQLFNVALDLETSFIGVGAGQEYQPQDTQTETSTEFHITDGGFELQGSILTDTIEFSNALQVKDQFVLNASTSSGTGGLDGVAGLLPSQNYPSILQSLVANGAVSSNNFCLNLDGDRASVILGSSESSLVPLTQSSNADFGRFFSMDLIMNIGDDTFGFPSIVSTTFTGVALPSGVASSISGANIEPNGFISFSSSSLPEVVFSAVGVTITLNPSDYLFSVSELNDLDITQPDGRVLSFFTDGGHSGINAAWGIKMLDFLGLTCYDGDKLMVSVNANGSN